VTTEGARRGGGEGRGGKSGEDLAGISTKGAKENSIVLKYSWVDAHHKAFKDHQ